MKTHSVRNGQVEIGIVEHQGNTFAAGGSSVNGNRVTGYVKGSSLTRWDGSTMLDCRSWIVTDYCNEFGDDSHAMVFRLTHGRAIVGYSLGDGMLFRGELVTLGRGASDRDFERLAESESEYWLRIDQEDEAYRIVMLLKGRPEFQAWVKAEEAKRADLNVGSNTLSVPRDQPVETFNSNAIGSVKIEGGKLEEQRQEYLAGELAEWEELDSL